MAKSSSCENIDICSLCQLVLKNGLSAPWIVSYCLSGNMLDCQRYQYKKEYGVLPELSLLPTGEEAEGFLKELIEKEEKENGC